MSTTCARTRDVDAYFEARLSPARQTTMRAHLPGCDPCRVRFARQQQLATLDPRAVSYEERVGSGLGLRAGGFLGLRAPAQTALFASLAAAAVVLVVRVGGDDADFRPRGAGEALAFELGGSATNAATEVLAFRTDQPAATLHTGQLPGGAELAFAYRNRGAWPWLMVFARDELGNVYWYQPPWTDDRADPRAVALSSEPGLHELPKAVAHVFRGRHLDLCALVSRQPLSVREVERQLAPAGTTAALLAGPEREAACRPLEVQR